MSHAPFPIQPELTSITVAYKNRRYIADEVLPRVKVGTQEFKYLKHSFGDNYTIPETRVGRLSTVPEVIRSATEVASFTEDYGLEQPVPYVDIKNAPSGYDPLGLATEQVSELIALSREKRVADLVFGAGNYASANKTTLSGTTQWSHTSSTPIKAIMDAKDSMPMQPNILVIGRGAYSALIRHADIVAAMHGNSGTAGIATATFLAQLFELDAVYVGDSFANSAKKGQTVSLARLWGKHAALLYSNPLARSTTDVSFGITAQFGERVAMSWEDKDIGLRGGVRVRVGESVKELFLADNLGYLFTDAAA